MDSPDDTPTPAPCQFSRRSVLVLGATSAAAFVLAACTAAKPAEDPPADTTRSVPGGASPSNSGSTASATGARTISPSPATSSSEAASGPVLASLASISVGSAISARDAKGNPIIIARTGQAEVAAFSAVCPHEGAIVNPGSSTFVCPRHGSVFNGETGARISGPAPTGLSTVAVSISGQNVVAG